MKLHIIGALAAFALGTSVAMAQTTPPPATPTAAPAPRVIQFSGAVDTIYTKTLGNGGLQFASPATVPGDFAFGPSNARGFDYLNNQIEFEDLNISATLNKGPWGGRLLVNVGPQANVSYSYPSDFSGLDISQLYLSYTRGKLTLTGGKFGTLAGYESSESVNDTTVSRGILFWYQPATHLGGRLTYALSNKLTLIGGVNEGWNSWQKVSGLTAEYGLAYAPTSKLSLTAQGYAGYARLGNYGGLGNATQDFPAGLPAGQPTTAQGQKRLIDLVGTFKATKKLTLVANYDNGSQSCTTAGAAPPCDDLAGAGWAAPGSGSLLQWSGLAGYAIYQINPRLSGTLRYEGFHDANGYQTGYRQLWHEATAATSWAATDNLTLRAEYRHDVSGDPVFSVPAGKAWYQPSTSGSNSNSTLGLEALVHF